MADNLAGMMASGGAAAPGGAAFPPISNYKGVMLCDRPSADIGPAKPAPFNSAVVPPVQLGLNPPKKVSVYSTENKKKDTDSVLYKHKQYLAHLQKDIKAQKEAARKQKLAFKAEAERRDYKHILKQEDMVANTAFEASEDTSAAVAFEDDFM